MTDTLHSAQVALLRHLRNHPVARFSEMMAPTGMTSDSFKFHVRWALKMGYIQKTDDGRYDLTATGKIAASAIDPKNRQARHAPKLSLIMVVKRGDLFLTQERHRTPFYGYSGLLSAPAIWGEDFETTAQAETLKQTGVKAIFESKGHIRIIDQYSSEVLEDKLFVVLLGTVMSDAPKNFHWKGGASRWQSIQQIEQTPLHFEYSRQLIDIALSNQLLKTIRADRKLEDF